MLLLLMSSNREPPSLSLMHRTVSKVLRVEKSLTSHLTVLDLISTNLVLPCRVDLELLCCCNLFSNEGCEFVVSAGTSCIVVQEELLMLLTMMMFPKALLGLLLTPALTVYPDTFWKSTPRGRDPVISTESMIILKNSILSVGYKTDYFKCITNPRFCNR